MIFRFGIFPFVIGKAEKYHGVIDTWKRMALDINHIENEQKYCFKITLA